MGVLAIPTLGIKVADRASPRPMVHGVTQRQQHEVVEGVDNFTVGLVDGGHDLQSVSGVVRGGGCIVDGGHDLVAASERGHR